MKETVVIVSGVRTPMGGFQGALSGVSAPDLGGIVIRETIIRAGLTPAVVDEVIMGCVLTGGLGQGPARQASMAADLSLSTGATTINKLCGSGMKATMFAHDLISAGSANIIVAGGMESMSNAPYLIPKARAGLRMGHSEIKDHMFLDGLEDAASGRLMGSFAQDMADKEGFSREEMDAFAIESLSRANHAIEQGSFKEEIVPITVVNRAGEQTISVDEQPGKARIDKIPTLKPAFKSDGSITAANSSSISDGASALVLMKETTANALGITPLARIVGHTTQSQHPAEFTAAPVGSLSKLLDQTGWSINSIDLFEINEAFAMVTMLAMKKHNIPHEKTNIYGGACAMGHPIGSTGARILVTLINALKQTGGKRGVASLCIGGGEATSMALEML